MALANVVDLYKFQQTAELNGSVVAISQYLKSPSEDSYAPMKNTLDGAVAAYAETTSGTRITKHRILVTLADGTVCYDSTNNASITDITKRNNHDNALGKRINENHMSRIAIMVSALSSSGVGMEQKTSTTTGAFEQYLSLRIGNSAQEAKGFIRVSFTA